MAEIPFPERRVTVELHTGGVFCGQRCEAEFERGSGPGGLPICRLKVRAWGASDDEGERMALEFAANLRDSLTEMLAGIRPTEGAA